MDIIQEQGEVLIKFLKSEGKESIQSLIPFCSRFTLNIICGNYYIIQYEINYTSKNNKNIIH